MVDNSQKIQYKNLEAINKRLKYICDVFYISPHNTIYMHSIIPFIEKIAFINNNVDISEYTDIMYLPNTLFDFTKNAKKTKLSIINESNNIKLGQKDTDLELILNKLNSPSNITDIENQNIQKNIIPKMYSKLNLFLNDLYKINSLKFTSITSDEIELICSNNIINIKEESLILSLTKNLFQSIKKEDNLSYSVLSIIDEYYKNKKYVLYKKETDIITIYTLCAYLTM